jgi:hypothetical protein
MGAVLRLENGGRYRIRTYDPLRVNYIFVLFSSGFEAKLLFPYKIYFSFAGASLEINLISISAKLVP